MAAAPPLPAALGAVLQIYYDPNPKDTIIEEDKECVEAFFEIESEDFNPDRCVSNFNFKFNFMCLRDVHFYAGTVSALLAAVKISRPGSNSTASIMNIVSVHVFDCFGSCAARKCLFRTTPVSHSSRTSRHARAHTHTHTTHKHKRTGRAHGCCASS
jgi:RNA polymerase Rpb1, domain 7